MVLGLEETLGKMMVVNQKMAFDLLVMMVKATAALDGMEINPSGVRIEMLIDSLLMLKTDHQEESSVNAVNFKIGKVRRTEMVALTENEDLPVHLLKHVETDKVELHPVLVALIIEENVNLNENLALIRRKYN